MPPSRCQFTQDWLHLTSPLLRPYPPVANASAGSDASGFLALALEGEAQERVALLLAEAFDLATNNQDQSHVFVFYLLL